MNNLNTTDALTTKIATVVIITRRTLFKLERIPRNPGDVPILVVVVVVVVAIH